MTAAETMAGALLALVDVGARPPCAVDPEAWVSEDREQRRSAARRCNDCPVLQVCADLAAELKPSFGTWAGHDWTPKQYRHRTG